MRVWVLGSGSRGNAVLLECGGTRVLIDAGFPPNILALRLAKIGVAPESIEAVVLTHEHTDHVKGAAASAKRWGWAVYSTAGTLAGTPSLAGSGVNVFEAGATIALSRLEMETVRTPHDAAESVALVATCRGSGARVGVAYDLGVVTAPVRRAMRDLDVLVLEANHDDAMLQSGPYPAFVRDRIAGRFGHLSNGAAAELARESVHADLGHVVLAHLSENCNDPRIARGAVAGVLKGTRFRGAVDAAHQDRVVGPYTPRRRAAAAVQLALGL